MRYIGGEIGTTESRRAKHMEVFQTFPSALHISGHKIKVNFLFVSPSDSDIHDINNTIQLIFDLM